jgi:hypothetical protein
VYDVREVKSNAHLGIEPYEKRIRRPRLWSRMMFVDIVLAAATIVGRKLLPQNSQTQGSSIIL